MFWAPSPQPCSCFCILASLSQNPLLSPDCQCLGHDESGYDQLRPLGSSYPQRFRLLWRGTLQSQIQHTPGLAHLWSSTYLRYRSSAETLVPVVRAGPFQNGMEPELLCRPRLTPAEQRPLLCVLSWLCLSSPAYSFNQPYFSAFGGHSAGP